MTTTAVTSRVLSEMGELDAVSALYGRIWGEAMADELPPALLKALAHAGNYVAGAYLGAELVGAVVGFLGRDDAGSYLHSHILGVHPEHTGRNIGFTLKQHQRSWALDAGLSKITWTFDPLVRRNAHFNLQKLGAYAATYYESFYGLMTDDINAGDESDRLLIEWRLKDPRALAAIDGALPEPAVDADVICVEVPEDIVALRRSDPKRSLHWRHTVRTALAGAMSDGYDVVGFTRAGAYVLRKHGSRG